MTNSEVPEDVAEFAATTGDVFYAHTNEEAATANPFFPGIVAHGYLLVSWAAGLFVAPGRSPVLANYGLEHLRFLTPVAVGDAIRSYTGLERVALCAAGGLSHFVGEPRVGDIDEEFDRWFLDLLSTGKLDEILDIPNDELAEAGNGTGEIRAWVALAGAMHGAPGHVLAYEAVYEWINGMGVVLYDGDQATARA